ncbi:MAG: hypothetical protein LBI19_02090 [Oscillospiraceae bacterium]|nr:hypothetical protein [Oscillospiraceae bacterium]
MKYRGLIFGLSLFTVIGNLLYWMLAFTGLTPVIEIVPGYTAWFWSFPLPDLWLSVISALLAFSIKIKRDVMAIVCGLLTASSMIFLALNELMFSFYTGMIYLPLADIGSDLVIKIYCLSVGTFFITQFSRQIKNQFRHIEQN